MFGIKKFLLGVLIGVIAGLWVGMNLGKGQAIWDYPLAKGEVSQAAKQTASDVIDDTQRAVRKRLED